MKRSTKFALVAVAALGVAAVAVPVVAQQGQMQHDSMMDGGMGMMGQHGGMMGGAMGMMAGGKSYAMATFEFLRGRRAGCARTIRGALARAWRWRVAWWCVGRRAAGGGGMRRSGGREF